MLPLVHQGRTVDDALVPGVAAARRWWLFATYLAVALVDSWVIAVLKEASPPRDVVQNLVAGTGWFIASGLATVPWIAIAMIPGLALTLAITAGSELSLAARMLVGAISWAVWGAVLFLGAALVFGQDLFAASTSIGLALLAVSGAAFAAIGVRPETPPPGRILTTAAVLVAGFVIVASVLLIGRFPGPA
jgi:hypothetical protein